MFLFLVPAVLAGLLGVLAQHAGPEEYITRLRLLFLGAAALGWLGFAVFAWRKAFGWKGGAVAALALVAIRVCYVPIVAAAVCLTGWVEWIARLAGATGIGTPLHYALACFTAAFTSLCALLVAGAVTNIRKVGWIVVFLGVVGMGVLAFWHRSDRVLSPHPFAQSAPPPTTKGPGYLDVVERRDAAVVTRVLAAGGGIRHAISARSGWAGRVRQGLLVRYRGNPDLSMGERITCLEAALLAARE